MVADWCREHAALVSVRKLWLFDNRIGDAGAAALAHLLSADMLEVTSLPGLWQTILRMFPVDSSQAVMRRSVYVADAMLPRSSWTRITGWRRLEIVLCRGQSQRSEESACRRRCTCRTTASAQRAQPPSWRPFRRRHCPPLDSGRDSCCNSRRSSMVTPLVRSGRACRGRSGCGWSGTTSKRPRWRTCWHVRGSLAASWPTSRARGTTSRADTSRTSCSVVRGVLLPATVYSSATFQIILCGIHQIGYTNMMAHDCKACAP